MKERTPSPFAQAGEQDHPDGMDRNKLLDETDGLI